MALPLIVNVSKSKRKQLVYGLEAPYIPRAEPVTMAVLLVLDIVERSIN